MKCYHEYCQDHGYHTKSYLDETFGEGKWEIISHFDVLFSGWECDSNAWVVRVGDHHKLIMTNHGRHFEATKEHLLERIEAYKSVIMQTEEALAFLDG